ncbi:MAG: Calx-beta domain-containing protein [Pyrinomonadaceae bacterium]
MIPPPNRLRQIFPVTRLLSAHLRLVGFFIVIIAIIAVGFSKSSSADSSIENFFARGLRASSPASTSAGKSYAIGKLSAGDFRLALQDTAIEPPPVTVATNQTDYAPGEIVTITGSGWTPGEMVTLVLHEDREIPLHDDITSTVAADGDGNILDSTYAPEAHDLDVSYTLTATGATSGLTSVTSFTDANSASCAVSISTQTQTPCTGANVIFTVGSINGFTKNTTVTYQWKKNGNIIVGASGTATVNNAGNNTTSPITYTISSVSTSDNAAYTCEITGVNSCTGQTIISNQLSLTVQPTTTITSPPSPASQTVCEGVPVSFSVGAVGSNLTYQWYRDSVSNNNKINGATSSTYRIASASTNDTGNYLVVVSGACGTVTPAAAGLTVNSPTSITRQPVSQTITYGADASFTATASGLPQPSIQWQQKAPAPDASFENIPNANGSPLTIRAPSAAQSGTQYRAVFSNACGSNAVSGEATLTVNKVTPVIDWMPPNDKFYGTPLSSQQLNATANIPGTFVYNPPAGTILNAALNNNLSVHFTPNDAINYTDADKTVKINIVKAPLTITADDKQRRYGEANPSFTGTINGIANGDNITATFDSNATSISPVGTYQIVPTLVDPDRRLKNYTQTVNNGTLTIIKGVQTISWNNPASITYGTTLGADQLNATVTGASGGTAPGALTYTPAAGALLNAGDQTLTVTAAATDNYNEATGLVTLRVNKAAQTITFDPLADKRVGDPPFNLSAASSSGLPVAFRIVSGAATVSGNTLTINGAGTITVAAAQSGDSNYTAAPGVSRSFNAIQEAQPTPTPTPTPTPSPTPVYTLSGQVVDDVGNGVAGVSLSFSGGTPSNLVVTNADGGFSFQSVAAGGSYTITPSKQNFTFSPPSRSFTNLSANQTLSFTATLRVSALTPTGANVVTQVGPTTLTFANVIQAGITSLSSMNPSAAGTPPGGFVAANTPAFEISTTAIFSGQVTTCFEVLSISDPAQFARLRALHGENGVLVDRTTRNDFASRTVCSSQNSLSPFVLAQFIAEPTPVPTPTPVQTFSIAGRVADAGSGAGVSGIAVTLSGANSASTFTDQSGNYAFTALAANLPYTVAVSNRSYNFSPSSRAFNRLNGNQTVNFNSTLLQTPRPPDDLSEDFSGDQIDPTKFTIGTLTQNFDPLVLVVQQNGTLQITPRSGVSGESFGGIVSVNAIDLTTTPSVAIEVVQTTNGDGSQTIFSLGNDRNNFYRFLVTGKDETANVLSGGGKNSAQVSDTGTAQTLFFQTSINGQKFTTGITYNPVEHRYWRLRHEAVEQTMNFETSPDARIWTLRSKSPLAKSVKALIAELSAGTVRAVGNPGTAIFDNFAVAAPVGVQFGAPAYSVVENSGRARITVTRTGNTESQATIAYATANGTAIAGVDYIPTSGTLRFGVGENSKSFEVRIIDDAISEPDETLTLTLSNPIGAASGVPASVVLTILDDDNRKNNPIDEPPFFVRQQYLDFLGREPDQGGLDYWAQEISNCGSDSKCVNARRIDVSAAFFIEPEFQDTGSFVYRFYKASYGQRPGFDQFAMDRNRVVGGANMEASKQAFAAEWVNRPEFHAAYDKLLQSEYVDALYANAGVKPSQEDRTSAILGLLTDRETRQSVLLKVVANDEFSRNEYNQAFVLMQYFAYLRRDPEEAGYQFWLDVVNNRVPGNYRAMVCAFLTSAEYQFRFGAIRTRTDADCSR